MTQKQNYIMNTIETKKTDCYTENVIHLCYMEDDGMTKTITIRLNDEEYKVFDEYSKIYKGGLSTMIKHLALERIQDEFDLQTISAYEKGLKDGSITIRPYDELLEEAGIK